MSAVLAVVAALLAWLGFAGVGAWPLAFVAFIPLFVALERAGRGGGLRVFGVSWLFGSVAWGASCSWLLFTLRTFSGLPLWACVALALALFLALGSVYAWFGWLFWRARRRGAPAALAAAAAVAACEWLYPRIFPGYYGASLHELALLRQSAELGGPLLLSALCLAVNGALAELRARPRAARATALVLVAALGWGAFRSHAVGARIDAAPRLRVGLVQPNVGAHQKWSDLPENARRLFAGMHELRDAGPLDLVLWPEAAWAVGVQRDLARLPEPMRAGLAAPLLFGSVVREPEGIRNRVLLAGAGGEILGVYDKVERMPFGEYLPFAASWPEGLRALWPARASVVRGTSVAPLALGAVRIAPLVCLEDLLPGFVRRAVREGEPHLLVNLSNDAWFGEGSEVRIHEAMARLRAVEQRRTLVRVTNTGRSAVIDPLGRIVAEAPPFVPATLVAEAPLLEGATLYLRLGDWPGALGALTIGWLAFVRREGGAAVRAAAPLRPTS